MVRFVYWIVFVGVSVVGDVYVFVRLIDMLGLAGGRGGYGAVC